MNKTYFAAFLLAALLICNSVMGQTQSDSGINKDARVLGEISDGRPGFKAPTRDLPKYQVYSSRQQRKNGRQITINRVKPPVGPINIKGAFSVDEIAKKADELETYIKNIKESGGFFTVSATIYDHKATRVSWRSRGEEFVAWSNVDWNHLGGFVGFEARNKQYEMILFSGNSSVSNLQTLKEQGYEIVVPVIPRLPSLHEEGARYMMVKGDVQNDEAMEFIEAIHDLYEAEKNRLIEAYHERRKNSKNRQVRNEELRRNPPPKADVIINYWKRHTPTNLNRKDR